MNNTIGKLKITKNINKPKLDLNKDFFDIKLDASTVEFPLNVPVCMQTLITTRRDMQLQKYVEQVVYQAIKDKYSNNTVLTENMSDSQDFHIDDKKIEARVISNDGTVNLNYTSATKKRKGWIDKATGLEDGGYLFINPYDINFMWVVYWLSALAAKELFAKNKSGTINIKDLLAIFNA